MGKNTAIQWAHHTFNVWRGCTKVSAGCKNCYALKQAKRNPRALGVWGRDGARVIAAESYWRQPVAWNKAAAEAGERHRVFCASMADVFEGEDTMPAEAVEPVRAARARLFELIDETPHLDWLLLTKRPENVLAMLPNPRIGDTEIYRPNIWLGVSVEDRAALPRLATLGNVPAAVRFASFEPLLEELGSIHGLMIAARLDWAIIGGESGPGARRCSLHHIRELMYSCGRAGVPAFVKQLGSEPREYSEIAGALAHVQLDHSKGGDPAEWPEDLRVRDLPRLQPAEVV